MSVQLIKGSKILCRHVFNFSFATWIKYPHSTRLAVLLVSLNTPNLLVRNTPSGTKALSSLSAPRRLYQTPKPVWTTVFSGPTLRTTHFPSNVYINKNPSRILPRTGLEFEVCCCRILMSRARDWYLVLAMAGNTGPDGVLVMDKQSRTNYLVGHLLHQMFLTRRI